MQMNWRIDLETNFGGHRVGIIFNGHDHPGCDVLHHRLSGAGKELSLDHDECFTYGEIKRRWRRAEMAESAMERDYIEEREEEYGYIEEDEMLQMERRLPYEAHL